MQQAASSGVKWSSLSQVARQVMQFVTTAILARLLSPSDFGLLGMATIVIGFLGLFMDLGTSAAVIQRKNISESLLHSIFWVNVAFGFLAMFIVIVLSPLAATFYQEPRLTLVLQTLSISFLVSGLGILQKSILERNLAFNKLAKIEITAVVTGSVIGITMAFLQFGVWSLVYQSLAVVMVTTFMLWFTNRWQPRLIFNFAEVQDISSYSLNLTGFTIFNYFSRNADYLLIGKFLGSEELGYYTLAYRLMLYPLQNISAVIGRVMFPLLSQIQDNNPQFRKIYLKVIACIALITFPIMVGIWAIAEPFILTIFGSQWQPVIILLMILAPVGMIQSLATTVGTIYQAKGRTDWMLRWGIVSGGLVMLALIIGLQWGILGVAVAYALASLILTYPGFAIPFRLIQLPMQDFLAVVWRPLLASLLLLLWIMFVKVLITPWLTQSICLLVLSVMSVFSYIGFSLFFNKTETLYLINMIKYKKT